MQLTTAALVGEVLGERDTVTVVYAPHPLRVSDRRVARLPAGQTLAELAGAVAGPGDFITTINGDPVPRDRWARVRPKPGTTVTIRRRVRDDAWRTVALLAVAVAVTFITGGAAAPLLGSAFAAGTFGAAALAVGVSLASSVLVNALFPVRPPQLSGRSDTGAITRFSIAGSRNQAVPYEPLPSILGRCRVFAPLLAKTYTELVGDDQYANVLVAWGYGPLEISDYKIGETSLESFSDYTLEERYGLDGDAPISQFPRSVAEEALSITLSSAADWVSRNTAEDVNGFSVDVTAPEGAWQIVDDPEIKEPIAHDVEVQFRYRDLAGGDWINLPTIIFGRTTSVIRRGHTVLGLNGQYEVQIRKNTVDSDSFRVHDTVIWTAMRSIYTGDPDNFPVPVAKTALRIRASDQLNGVVDALNAVVTSKVTAFNGTSWTALTASNNPADLFRHVLQGPANVQAVPDDEIDLDCIESWWSYCKLNSLECNMVRSGRASVWDTLADIAATGRATPTFIDGKWAVIWDQPAAPEITILSPRNSWGFSSPRSYKIKPHGLKVRFINEELAWQQDERIVYDDGYSAANASLFESTEFPGVTKPSLIWKHARFHIAQARLRPERPTLSVAWEHLNFTRGDRVRLQHDVMLIGQITGRIKAFNDPGITLDEFVTMEAGKNYGIRYRQNDGTLIFRRVHTDVGETTGVRLSDLTPGAAPDIGALFTFGEWDGEARDSGVFRVFAITAQDDLCAQVTLVDDAPAISLADSGIIPDYEPNITEPVDPFHLPPKDLRLSEVIEGRGASAQAAVVLSWQAPPRGSIATYPVQWRDDGATQAPWRYVGSASAPQTTLTVRNIPTGVHSFRVRADFTDGTISQWVTLNAQAIQGLLANPPDVENFRISVLGEASTLTWDGVLVDNLIGYELRFSPLTSGVTWNASTELQRLVTGQSAQVATRTGTYLIKAKTAQGKYSPNATLVVSLVEGAIRNVVEVIEEDPDFGGLHDGTVVDDEQLRLGISNAIESWDALSEVLAMSSGTSDIPPIIGEGIYEFEGSLDLGDVYSSRITAAAAAFGLNVTSDFFAPADFFEPEDFFGDAGINDWSVTVEVRTTGDDPTAPLADWSDWAPLIAGDYRARAFQFRAVLRSFRIDVTPVVDSLSVTIDMPDRIVAAEDVTVPAAGLTITFDPPFKALKALNVTGQDLATGDYLEVTAKTESSATLRFFTSGGSGVQRTADYAAIGYGKQAA